MTFTRATQLTPEVAAEIDDAFNYQPWDAAKIDAGASPPDPRA